MARIRPTQSPQDDGFWDEERPSRRRKAVRYGAPVALVGITAATIGLVPALADTGDPSLPKISAEELISRIAASDTEQLSGSVKVTTDLGIPGLSAVSGLPGLSDGRSGAGGGAAPEAKLTELAAGSHTLRVAADGPDRQRVSIIEKAAEYSVIHNGDQVWAYDSASNSVYHAKAPEGATAEHRSEHRDLSEATPGQLAKDVLAAADGTTRVGVEGTAKVAGRDAYELVLRPKQSGSTIGSIRLAVDARTGVPLRFVLAPKSGGKAVVSVGFTSVDFGKPKARAFAFTPPKGAKVTEADTARGGADADRERSAPGAGALSDLSGLNVIGKGWSSVARLDLPGAPPTAGKDGPAGSAGQFLDSLGKKVSGRFGSGRLVSTRLVNALVTDSGRVFVGAVDQATLVRAADSAA